MAGHPMLSQVKSETSVLDFSGRQFNVVLTYHKVSELSGHAVGIKFSDVTDSMDSSKSVKINGMLLGKAIGERVVEMTRNLHGISFLGFYLLTDEIEKERGKLAVRAKLVFTERRRNKSIKKLAMNYRN